MENENRTDLKKYYRKVAICNMCRKQYGMGKESNGTCPKCGFYYKKNRGVNWRN